MGWIITLILALATASMHQLPAAQHVGRDGCRCAQL
jgi:hypothetical protein